jgi:hypothetical protein|tara:strand:+ start:2263 stop:3045 length:783 start_codon:yes stop_codon:yes gene_type:complete
MVASVEVLSADVERNLKVFARKVGITLKDAYKEQMRLAANQLVRDTPPRSMKQGRNRIKQEVGHLFVRLGPKNFILAEQWEAMGNQPAGKYFKTARGKVFGVEQPHWNLSGNQSRMKAHHKRNRGKGGRSSMAGSWDRTIGRWRFINRQVVSTRAYENYLKRVVYPKIGTLKKGWIAPDAPFITKAAGWVKKAKTGKQSRGDYSDQMDMFANGFLKLKNVVPYFGSRDFIIKKVMRTRINHMKRMVGKHLERTIVKFNAR